MKNKYDNTSSVITSRFSEEEFAILETASRLSGRTRSDVIRRLIWLADTQAGREVLGIRDSKPDKTLEVIT